MRANAQDTPAGRGRTIRRLAKGLVLLLPFVGMLIPWIYNTDAPRLLGVPFFYWYQIAWIPLTMLLLLSLEITESRRSDR